MSSLTATPADMAPVSPYFTVRFFWWGMRWLRRYGVKLVVVVAVLFAAAWYYEDWRGKHALQEQRALWMAEYGAMKREDFLPARVPDAENFFASPGMAAFVVPDNRLQGEAFDKAAWEAEKKMPHAEMMHLRFPTPPSVPGGVKEISSAHGLKTLDISAWAAAMKSAGKTPPDGSSDAAWLQASMPPEGTIAGLIEALSRPKSSVLPHVADRWAVGDQLADPAAIPIIQTENAHGYVEQISLRSRIAARAGDARTARDLSEIGLRMVEGFADSANMSGTLAGLGIEGAVLKSVDEGIASGCWSEADLKHLSNCLERIDEEQSLFRALSLEGFGWHLWPLEQMRDFHRKIFQIWKTQSGSNFTCTLLSRGPEGWIDANLANHLRWWQMLMIPNSSGDDLIPLANRLTEGKAQLQEEFAAKPNPRNIMARVALPAIGRMAETAAAHQTHRRQLILALALERYRLAKGNFPEKVEALVPEFLPAIPGDPWVPGTAMGYTIGEGNERYRLISKGPDGRLAFPVKL